MRVRLGLWAEASDGCSAPIVILIARHGAGARWVRPRRLRGRGRAALRSGLGRRGLSRTRHSPLPAEAFAGVAPVPGTGRPLRDTGAGAQGVEAPATEASSSEPTGDWPALRARRRRWAELLRTVFRVEVEVRPGAGRGVLGGWWRHSRAGRAAGRRAPWVRDEFPAGAGVRTGVDSAPRVCEFQSFRNRQESL